MRQAPHRAVPLASPLRVVALVCLALAWPVGLHAAPPSQGRPGVALAVEDPSGRALQPWAQALHRAKKRKGQARMLFWGASHTAADVLTGDLRRALQDRYGEGGHGFVFPVRWSVGYRHQDLVVESSKGWIVQRFKKDDPQVVGDYGLAGLAASSTSVDDWAEVRTTTDNPHGRRFDRLEVWYRTALDGGTLRVEVDGREHLIATRKDASEPGFWALRLKDGPHRVRLQPVGDGPVTIYGLVTERSAPGVVVDQLGIPGMRVDIHLHWQDATFQQQVQRRRPDLLVLAYGTNDIGDEGEPIADYVTTWRKVLTRLKNAAPDAACLLIGPSDRLAKDPATGEKRTLPRTPAVIAAQKKVAAEFSCGYWDLQAVMGGPGSIRAWQQARLASRDDVHLTKAGYGWLAELLERALVQVPRVQAAGRAPGVKGVR